MAMMPARIASGSRSQASMTAAKSESTGSAFGSAPVALSVAHRGRLCTLWCASVRDCGARCV